MKRLPIVFMIFAQVDFLMKFSGDIPFIETNVCMKFQRQYDIDFCRWQLNVILGLERAKNRKLLIRKNSPESF